MSLREMGAVMLSALLISCSGDKTSPRDSTAGTKPASPEESPGTVAGVVAAPADARRTIIFLGTSLTAGLGLDPDSAYPQLIQRKIDASALPYQVVNAGVSGETSAGLLRRLEWVLQRPAEIVVVETGANDGLRGLPVASTRATIGEILQRVQRARPSAKVVLVQMEAPPNLGQQYTSEFREMFRGVAREHGAVLLPFLLEGVAGQSQLNQADGIHPNDAGERIVAENVWQGLKPLLSP